MLYELVRRLDKTAITMQPGVMPKICKHFHRLLVIGQTKVALHTFGNICFIRQRESIESKVSDIHSNTLKVTSYGVVDNSDHYCLVQFAGRATGVVGCFSWKTRR